jgi:sulfur carrier protein ThiS
MSAKGSLKVHLRLYSILREKLPPEAKGKVTLQLEEGATIDRILQELDIKRRVVVSVNDEYEPDTSRQLQDGDQIKIFSSVSGGKGQGLGLTYRSIHTPGRENDGTRL